jgi:predicted lipoprotein with Yx(FWY)xxD motif
MSPSGLAQPWAGELTTTSIAGQTVLATPMLTALGWIDWPVYSYSKDTSAHSACGMGPCAWDWPAMLTGGTPGVAGGLSASNVATIRTPAGTQVTYGKALYLYAKEGAALAPTGPMPTGSGNGRTMHRGTFSLVTP